jgi:hypothetical protein
VTSRAAARARGRTPSTSVRVVATALVLQLVASLTGAAYLLKTAERFPGPLRAELPPAVLAAPAPDPKVERERAVRALLDARATAVLARDREAFLATVFPGDPQFVERQSRLFDALAEVPLASWEYDLDAFRQRPADPALDQRYGTEWWAPDVQLRYAIAGFDTEPTYAPQRLTFVRSGSSWLLAADDDFEAAGEPSTRGLWDFGPVIAHRSEHALVLGHPGSRELLPQIGRVVDESVPRVDAVWQQEWSRAVVVLVPDDDTELDRMLGGSTDLSRIAAVATAELPDLGPADSDGFHPVGDRIIVNPPNFAKLGRLGRQVVLAHEVMHVATRRATGPDTPTWLVEGLADYVGYLETGVPVETAARELTTAVRAGRVPDALPADDAFDGGNGDIAQAYESSWLAFRLLVEQHGLEPAVRFYRAVGASRDAGAAAAVETAFARELGTTTAAFTAAWREHVVSTLS